MLHIREFTRTQSTYVRSGFSTGSDGGRRVSWELPWELRWNPVGFAGGTSRGKFYGGKPAASLRIPAGNTSRGITQERA